jgi:predicted phosphodiesterase
MRIAVGSDLHLPRTPAEVIEGLVADLEAHAPDAVVLAGDLGESSEDFGPCLALFRKLACPVLALAGNHDLFPGRSGSQHLWTRALPETVRRLGFRWLEQEPFVHGGVAVAGTVAWYDYSAADPAVSAAPRDFAREKHYFSPDDRIDWPWTDPEFAALVGRDFLGVLDRLEADAAVQKVVVVTHLPILDCQLLPWPDNPDWGFMKAYFGNLTLGREVLRRAKVTHVVSGHTHKEYAGRARDRRACRRPGGREAGVGAAGAVAGNGPLLCSADRGGPDRQALASRTCYPAGGRPGRAPCRGRRPGSLLNSSLRQYRGTGALLVMGRADGKPGWVPLALFRAAGTAGRGSNSGWRSRHGMA